MTHVHSFWHTFSGQLTDTTLNKVQFPTELAEEQISGTSSNMCQLPVTSPSTQLFQWKPVSALGICIKWINSSISEAHSDDAKRDSKKIKPAVFHGEHNHLHNFRLFVISAHRLVYILTQLASTAKHPPSMHYTTTHTVIKAKHFFPKTSLKSIKINNEKIKTNYKSKQLTYIWQLFPSRHKKIILKDVLASYVPYGPNTVLGELNYAMVRGYLWAVTSHSIEAMGIKRLVSVGALYEGTRGALSYFLDGKDTLRLYW